MNALVLQSLGPALGAFIGALVGLSVARRRGGARTGVLSGSIFVTASAAGGAALLVTMAINYLWG